LALLRSCATAAAWRVYSCTGGTCIPLAHKDINLANIAFVLFASPFLHSTFSSLTVAMHAASWDSCSTSQANQLPPPLECLLIYMVEARECVTGPASREDYWRVRPTTCQPVPLSEEGYCQCWWQGPQPYTWYSPRGHARAHGSIRAYAKGVTVRDDTCRARMDLMLPDCNW